MVSTVLTTAYLGLEARSVEVQVQIAAGLPAFIVVGLPDKAVAESRERVRAALAALGLALPPKRITVNLSPADLPKEGSHYDLPIALGLMAAMGLVDKEALAGYVAVGELALDGRLASSPGVLLAAMHAADRDCGLICPAAQGSEAVWAGDLEVLAAPDLLSLINHFKGENRLLPPQAGAIEEATAGPDLKQVKGQETARRALEIAAAGGHNLLMSGPPGAGKSLLASCLPGILPPLSAAEALQVSMVASVAGVLQDGKISRNRPFRAPHHSASMAALVGGGLKVRPGEVSLAHLGVLFLDELPEFKRDVLDSLRQPLEAGEVSVARANAHVTFPARVQLVAAMNPCRCGYLSDPAQACSRAPRCASDYQSRISGPLLDRIDLHVDVEAVLASDLIRPSDAETSATVGGRVASARNVQQQRYGQENVLTNAALSAEQTEQYCTPDQPGQDLLAQAADSMRLTARSYMRILKVARTIADLASAQEVSRVHIAEALSYRRQFNRS
jgi:magnesium chelatase family protein